MKQFQDRCSTYLCHGQPVDKIEIIVLGGTWGSYEKEYQEKLCRVVWCAANTCSHGGQKLREMKSLEEEQKETETALCRIIGFTIETRPDQISETELLNLNRLGVTRVQLGVQTIHDHLLKKINRKCYHRHTIRAIRLLQDWGFKVLIHLMPNLPDATPQLDWKCFQAVAYDSDIQPDELKIYPTSVTTTSDKDNTEVYTVLEKWYRDGKYQPYPMKDMNEVIKNFMEIIPEHMRISRIFRDIPVGNITGGADVPNLRQHLDREMQDEKRYCKCIRTREIRDEKFEMDEIYYKIKQYRASQGTNYFISANILPRYDNPYQKTLVGFCRLRIPNSEVSYYHMQESLRNSAIVRELHVYGQLQSTHNQKSSDSKSKTGQHRGIGKKLLEMAEEIAVDNGFNKLSVISGVGVRGYYRKQGYDLENYYMVKKLTKKTGKNWYLWFVFWVLLVFMITWLGLHSSFSF